MYPNKYSKSAIQNRYSIGSGIVQYIPKLFKASGLTLEQLKNCDTTGSR